MPRDDDDFLDDDLDPEGPSADDLERFSGEHRACPSCGSEVYDEATICPVCRTPVDTGHDGGLKLGLIVVVGLILIAFVLVTVF